MAIPPPLKPSISNFSSISKRVLFKGTLALLLAFFVGQLDFRSIDYFFFDRLVRTQVAPKQPSNIALIYVEHNTIEKLKKNPTFKDHLQLLKTLEKDHPFLVAYNINLNKIEGSLSDKQNFASSVLNFKNFIQILDDVTLKGTEDKSKLKYPFESIKALAGLTTLDTSATTLSGNLITRRIVLNFQELPLFHYHVAQMLNPEIKDIRQVHGSFKLSDTDQTLIDYRPHKDFEIFNFIDVIQGKVAPASFANKVVLIGTDLNLEKENYISTPLNYAYFAMPTLEMHANMIDTLVRNTAPVIYPAWLRNIIVFVLAFLLIHIVLNLQPTKGLTIVAGLFLFITVLGWIVFNVFKIWLPLWHSYLTLFICYYFFIPYRLIIENRRSWEYYEKNKILKQVEELKTNFISMMSHDLKTPIARIQGMSDVILKDANLISPQQREAVDTIKQSGDDLLKFINSILDYAKIESEGIKLNFESRDLNALVQEVLKKFEFHAKIKKIKIEKSLEPLFPISMDPNLIKQVLSNLIENAIKYSPEQSSIHIKTLEENSKVYFSIQDEGPGIAPEDLPHVFDKFFRTKNAKISPVKGSGLGLYLAKYFINMHGGEITVESQIDKGTTFSLSLPIN